MHFPQLAHSIVVPPLARDSFVIAPSSQVSRHTPQSLHLLLSTFTLKGLTWPANEVRGMRGQIKLQKILFLVSIGPMTRKTRPPVTKMRARIQSKVVLTAGGSKIILKGHI